MEDDSSDEEPEQLQCKIILLGDGAVGKTSIALRFTEDHFATQYNQTIDDAAHNRMMNGGLWVRAQHLWRLDCCTRGQHLSSLSLSPS